MHTYTQSTCSLTSLVCGCDIVECSRAVGLGHCSRQLRHLPQSHYGLVYRLPGQSSQCHQRGVYGRLGDLQCKFTFAERGSQSWSCKANKVVVGVECSTPFTFIAFRDGSRRVRCVRWITETGSFRNMVVEQLEGKISREIQFRQRMLNWAGTEKKRYGRHDGMKTERRQTLGTWHLAEYGEY